MKRTDDRSDQPAGDSVVSWEKEIFLKEALAAYAAITPLTQVQQRFPAKGNILDRLHSVVVYTVSERAAGWARLLCSGEFEENVYLSRNVFNICNNRVFQVQQFCGIIFVEHRDLSFVVIGGTFMIRDFSSMLNFFHN